jgi:hypothetical protein
MQRAALPAAAPATTTIALMSFICPVRPNDDHPDRRIHSVGPRIQTPENHGMNASGEAVLRSGKKKRLRH